MSRLAAIMLLWGMLIPAVYAAPDSVPSPVVVELFTSEGCSSCPHADALLAQLDQTRLETGYPVLVLSEHVDYWNHLGWKDRFSSAGFTERQKTYAQRFSLESAYTPEMVIDGRYESSGNNEAGVRGKITQASQTPKEVAITLSWKGSNLVVEAQGVEGSKADVFVAVTENGLSTSVAKGENGGRTLKHAGVVRELRRLGSLSHGRFSTSVALHPKADWKPENLRAIVFAQNSKSGAITGAAAVNFVAVPAGQTGN